ncbi:hypothetical protein BDW72DRAFT_158699 [Aspergillus terricola var. indicus]
MHVLYRFFFFEATHKKKVILPLFPVVIFYSPVVFFISLPDTGFSHPVLSLVLSLHRIGM